MPIYEFRCQSCHQEMSIFTRQVKELDTPGCPSCGSSMKRLISSFAYHKSLQTIHEEAGEPTMSPGSDYYKDPRNIGRWAEKRLGDLGVEMPSQAREMIDAAREGELPPSLKDL